jgi:hypothetical protein
LFLGRRIRLRRRSCGLLLANSKLDARSTKAEHPGMVAARMYVAIDSQYAGLRCSSTRFGEAFLAGSIKGRCQEKPLFRIRSSGIIA